MLSSSMKNLNLIVIPAEAGIQEWGVLCAQTVYCSTQHEKKESSCTHH